ncbi:hypothetical protein H7J87_11985 [Mycolicibacterium wolinskyi]|uniref:Uncharacterized protein n=1 Tax=Mycolicibacterium wolinskyi TaxID=59750 RepID=A0A1X2FJ78_9MYCO|nr:MULTISPECIES: hypothetical protein [Mycolicibacterium]MCV7286051.1 hypothetical protein [Mycolicibacterium wolinskyi]MCV7296247.1 hypothetical protein [Mycolicibacterium goodii]ORX18476.1 hypothetical protein AWC31_14325 [Mycolicibacterium wolinskyi]
MAAINLFGAAVKISLLRHMLTLLEEVKELPPDQEVRLLEMLIGMFDAYPEVHGTEPTMAKNLTGGFRHQSPALHADGASSGIDMIAQEIRRGTAELQAEHRIPVFVQKAADHLVAYRQNRHRRAEARRPVPPSLDGLVVETRVRLIDRADRRRRGGPVVASRL